MSERGQRQAGSVPKQAERRESAKESADARRPRMNETRAAAESAGPMEPAERERPADGIRLIGTEEESRLDPHEIDFLPQFEQGRGPRQPFVNRHGVVIGDHEYDSPHSPLANWSEETDPAIMAGEEWVHPFKDIGFHAAANRDYFEKGIPPQGVPYLHPVHDAAYRAGSGHRADAGGPDAARGGGRASPDKDAERGETKDAKDGGGCRE